MSRVNLKSKTRCRSISCAPKREAISPLITKIPKLQQTMLQWRVHASWETRILLHMQQCFVKQSRALSVPNRQRKSSHLPIWSFNKSKWKIYKMKATKRSDWECNLKTSLSSKCWPRSTNFANKILICKTSFKFRQIIVQFWLGGSRQLKISMNMWRSRGIKLMIEFKRWQKNRGHWIRIYLL